MTDHDHAHSAGAAAVAPSDMAPSDMAKDPVCGMQVRIEGAKHTALHHGQNYYFCSSRCQEKFQSDPAHYASGPPAPAENSAAGSEYTCPMHPEVRQTGPGNCPICGMALE
ncbi:MAG: YHS domain-containing protein, partial [Alphaproteobacteria bacterium]|nr:YHS domain-containing protein [Alphaproteobacteria bacterium]